MWALAFLKQEVSARLYSPAGPTNLFNKDQAIEPDGLCRQKNAANAPP